MSVRRFSVYSFFAVILSTFSLCYSDTNLLINPGFENIADGNWVRRNCTFAYTNEQHRNGSYSGKASDRTATWQGLQQSLLGKLKDGNSCTISAWVRLNNAASDTVRITIQKTVDGVTSYDGVASGTANNTGWVYLSGNYTLTAPGNISVLYVYFEGPAIGVNFYVDDANVAVTQYVPPPPVDNSVKAQFCWMQQYSGSATGSDYAQDIALDSAGNVYVTGYAKNTGTNYDFATIKYSPDGTPVWTRTYNNPGSYTDYATAMAVDANSDIVVAGCSYTTTGYDGIIVKYTSSGNQLWAKAYNYSGTGDDIFYDVAVDSSRNIYAIGERNGDCLIVKFTPDGNVAWTKIYNGSANGYDSLYSLALDASGNVYACGESAGIGTDQDCLVLKYSSAGNLLWAKTYNGPANGWDLLEAIAVDSAGNAYVTGSVETATDSDYITIKYAPDGNLLWTASYTGTAWGWDESYAITLTSDGNVAVTGYSQGTTSADAATVKYNSQTGAQVWASRYNGTGNSTDYTEAIAADSRGNVYVAGRSTEGSSMDYLTICYGPDGTMFWKMSYNGPASQMDIATAIAVSGDEVYVTGRCADSSGKFDYGTVKYTPFYVDGQADASIRYQVLEGFGASNTWSGNGIVALGNYNPAIFDVIFGDLGLDILRLRNTYGYGDNYITNSAQTIAAGRARTGRPLKILLCSWAPSANLKSNGALNGGGNATLARDEYGNYRYNDYAQWWYDSIVYYRSLGISPDYVSMQNEPDYDAAWDSCRFDPTENGAVAGYDQAFDAFSVKIATLPNPPKMLAPETAGFISLADYINALIDRSPVYGYDHHLYNGGGGVDNPDAYIPAMTNFATAFNDKPRMQTEFSKGDVVPLTFTDSMNLALMMHNSLVVEGASSYMYWELAYSAPQGLVMITPTSWTINPVYYAFKHYSAFTDPNWQRIEASTTDPNLRISAYISPNNNQISIVIINPSYNFTTLDISSLGNFNAVSGKIYRTIATENCALIGEYEEGVSVTLPAKSIVTVALTGNTSSCSNPPAGDLNHDCQVDFFDIVALGASFTGSQANHLTLKNIADTWLQCGLANPADCWQ
ncbi:MAG: carbohydrate binding domain-containing protein [Sedimentisphaerales bacterium]